MAQANVLIWYCQKNVTESLVGEILSGFSYAEKEVEHMPRKPKHPCSYPGCPELTDRRYCESHEKLMNQNYEKYERNKSSKRRYGRAWKRIRDKYVSLHPFCEVCYEKGILVETEEVHHKKPLSEGGTHERDNLIALCKSCHSRIHAERGDRFNSNREYTY